MSTPLLSDGFAPVLHPHFKVRSPDDLRRVPLIHFAWRNPDPAHPTWPGWLSAAGLAPFEAVSSLHFSDESHAIQATVAGQGAALLSLVLVQEELVGGLIVQPFGPVVTGLSYHLVEAPGGRMEAIECAKRWLLTEVTDGGGRAQSGYAG